MATQAYSRAIGAADSFVLEEAALRDAMSIATDVGTPAASALASSFGALLSTISQVRVTLGQASNVEVSLANVAQEFEEQNATYYELRKEQQSVNEALKVEENSVALAKEISLAETPITEYSAGSAVVLTWDERFGWGGTVSIELQVHVIRS